jgi:hypothetical protein
MCSILLLQPDTASETITMVIQAWAMVGATRDDRRSTIPQTLPIHVLSSYPASNPATNLAPKTQRPATKKINYAWSERVVYVCV